MGRDDGTARSGSAADWAARAASKVRDDDRPWTCYRIAARNAPESAQEPAGGEIGEEGSG